MKQVKYTAKCSLSQLLVNFCLYNYFDHIRIMNNLIVLQIVYHRILVTGNFAIT